MIIQYAIELIIKEIAGDNEMLAMILNIVAMVAMSGWEGSPTYGPDPNAVSTGPVTKNSLGQSMGGGASQGWTNVSRAPTNSFHFNNLTSFNFSNLTAMDFANIAFNVITGINTVALHKVNKLNEQLAQDKIDFKAYTDKTAIEDAGYQILEPLIDPTDLTMIMRATNRGGALGGHKYFALFEAQYELPYTSWAFSETIGNKITNTSMYV